MESTTRLWIVFRRQNVPSMIWDEKQNLAPLVGKQTIVRLEIRKANLLAFTKNQVDLFNPACKVDSEIHLLT